MKDGKFHANYRKDVCSECGRETKLQSGTSVCNECLNDATLAGLRRDRNKERQNR